MVRVSSLAIAGATVWLAAGHSRAEEPRSYICATEQMVGFHLQDGQWRQTTFQQLTFVLKYQKGLFGLPPAQWAWSLTQHGEKEAIATCTDTQYDDRKKKTVRGQFIQCNERFKFRFDKKTLRFLISYFVGYTDGVDSNENTPTLGIGKCTPL